MAREFTPKVLTANDLLEGDAIYRAADGGWTRHHLNAKLFVDAEAAQVALVAAEQEAGVAVGPYLADAVCTSDGPRPVHFREAFRARGPSNYAHGKQESTDVAA